MNKYINHIDSFYQAQRGFVYLTSFHLTRDTELEGLKVSVQIILAKSTFDHDEHIVITFTGVQDLKLGSLTILYPLAFDIIDVSKDQLEGVRYKVDESEGNVFSFYCSQITFEILG
ncbi:hypothetical protein H1230_10775 [Paenibacillus sp. 19GGS1-52]|uniref:hypothetical protein n=1 Tax=Paenibacillus sp. 19GGS1-52 TaxID=2758563 RepID=UPI001EFB00A8|nr:hypothetical protein [Paenibacillus sp. 19GGS1-52]ULO09206.1 hypothetical protein H1230_10775 [Paenibacillus sp. 19GGS1-52]